MKKIGRFTIAALLGKGGMGKVFKIEYPVTGKIAALKLLDPQPLLTALMGKTALEELFIREALTMARIRHPAVAELLDFDTWQGKHFYIMEFYCNNLGTLIGESYETERPSRIIGVDRAVAYTSQILEGLSCLHHFGIIHRDIKPFNILLTDYDTVKICDFGLSRLRGETFQTHESIKVGSPYYAAPEQESAPDSADSCADLYSAGVMLFRMLTGSLPMDGNQPVSSLNPDLDPGWDRFIQKTMAREPGKRFQKADDMHDALAELYQAWLRKKEAVCEAPHLLEQNDSTPAVIPGSIRSTPMKISAGVARDSFGLDELMRPTAPVQNRFIRRKPVLVEDETTGLIWQWSGTRYPVNWKAAKAYVERLNREKHEGLDNWRMPTIDELLTIISRSPSGNDLCLEPIFDPRQKWLWSADRASFLSAWYVSLDLGFVERNDFASFYHVKAVCRPAFSPQPTP